MSLLQRVQSWAPVPVYPVTGEGGAAPMQGLRLRPALTFVSSIRHASVLLVCGNIREADRPALRRLHDQLAHPRATFWWRAEPLSDAADPVSDTSDDPVEALCRLDRLLRTGARTSEADWLPNEPPNPWKGEGAHGQGGKGMMGGVPYGRPMAMTDQDLRDGLMLDAMTLRLGPFAPMLPAGLSLELTLQGDVVQAARVLTPVYADKAPREHASLWQAADLLNLLGLEALALQCRSVVEKPGFSRRKLLDAARRAGAFLAIPPNLGRAGVTDVRSRLRSALLGDDHGISADILDLVELLVGCEWQEAMLVINSFTRDQLIRIAPVTPEQADGEGAANPSRVPMQHHGAHG